MFWEDKGMSVHQNIYWPADKFVSIEYPTKHSEVRKGHLVGASLAFLESYTSYCLDFHAPSQNKFQFGKYMLI